MTQCLGQTICLTDKQFEFYGDAVIDRETLKKENKLLELKIQQQDTALTNRNNKITELENINKEQKTKSDNFEKDLTSCGNKVNNKQKWLKVFIKTTITSVAIIVIETVIIYYEVIRK